LQFPIKNREISSTIWAKTFAVPKNFNLQPENLQNELVTLVPLEEKDFESLFQVASDPLVWEQHPNKFRYQRAVFQNYFEGAIQSKGAFLILETKTNESIGSSRFYDYDQKDNSIIIGYTFIGRNFWGKEYNKSLKKLMLDYAFQYVDKVYFHIGAQNIRSQKAIEKIGAIKIDEQEVTYYGEDSKLNFIYVINKN
jgi:RimJ/RimL family protein N-acetyltransferase